MQSNPGAKQAQQQLVIDLESYMEQKVRVKFQGGREVQGVLKGFDSLCNIVLDSAVEFIRDPNDPYVVTAETRPLGLLVCRGPQISLISPSAGFEEVENPFA